MSLAHLAVLAASFLIAVSAIAGQGLPIEEVGGVELPSMTPSEARAAVSAVAEPEPPAAMRSAGSQSEKEAEATILQVEDGTTEIVRIAKGYLNRIVTPFDAPKVLTVNAVEVQREGQAIFVATSSSQPVGIHILAEDASDPRSVSLTLIPAQIPPRSISLQWSDGVSTRSSASDRSRAQRWEQAAPYEERLLDIVSRVARGEVPDGYTLSEEPDALPCDFAPVQFSTGQRLMGAHLSVYILRATNSGTASVELTGHAGCDVPGVALVAPWPVSRLEPGAATELYVVTSDATARNSLIRTRRPSLVN